MRTNKNTGTFFLLTFLFSWLVWGGMMIFEPSENFFIPLLFLGAFGPSLIAVLMISLTESKEFQKDFWNRVFNFNKLGVKWLLLIFLIFPVILILGYTVYYFVGGEMPDFSSHFSGLDNFEAIVYFLIFMLLGGPLAEELGWRGYALDPLKEKWWKFKGSMILGFFWVIWHLPLFFIEGTSQFQKGFGIPFWSWVIQIFVLSVIFTWVHNHTGKSILAAILLHFMANFAYPLGLDAKGEVAFTAVRILIILPILISWSREAMKLKFSKTSFS